MDPFDPDRFIDATSPVVQILVVLLPLILLALVLSLAHKFVEDCKEYGLGRSILVWGWEFAFFPVMIASVVYLGWWGLAVAFAWLFGPTDFGKSGSRGTGQNPPR